MKREYLPNRRESYTMKLTADGVTAHVSISPPHDVGAPKEVFISGPRPGSQMDHVLHDVAVIISVALQYGIEPAALAKSITRTPQGNAHSIVGAVIDLLNLKPSATVENDG